METRHLPLTGIPALNLAEVHVWYARPGELALPALVLGGHRDCRESRRSRLQTMRMQQRFLLRLLLGGYLGCPGRDVRLVRNAAGKPMLDSPDGAAAASDLAFNLSHAGDWLAIAVARGLEPGIDIESLRRALRWRRLAQRWFPLSEARAVECAESPAREFLRRWTAREAMIKAMGDTLAASLARIQLDSVDADRPMQCPEHWPPASSWSLRHPVGPEDLEVCLASAAPLRQLREFRLTTDDTGPHDS